MLGWGSRGPKREGGELSGQVWGGEPWSHTAPGGLSPRVGARSKEGTEEASKGN